MKLIHCADLHLDSHMTTHLSGERAKARKAELLHTFERMIEFADDNEVRAILIAGDLFDRKNVSVTARKTVYRAVAEHPQITFYYLRGNHDVTSFLPEGGKCPDNLRLFDEDWTSYCEAEEGDRRLVISGMELGGENAHGMSHSLTLDHHDFNIVMLHGQEQEHETRDKAQVIPLRALRNKGIDYLALGHIHAYKKEVLDSRAVYCYPGCLEGRGFDECGEHGFVLLDIDLSAGTCRSEFVPFASRELYRLELDVSDCMSTAEILDRVREACRQQGCRENDFLEVVLRGRVDMACEKDMDYLVNWLQQDFYFVKGKDETGLRVDYESFALDESLKGEFVRTVRASEELSDEDKAQVIQYGIRALAGEEI